MLGDITSFYDGRSCPVGSSLTKESLSASEDWMATSKRKTANEPVTTAAAEPSSDDRDSEVAHRAYDRYQRRGCVDGHYLDDWFAAEREFESARNAPPD